ncbi:MAG: uracil-DNA glycosylase [Syntrophus sp. (in: bacteria)]|jgi:hypothetical protein|nr:uracil-DNA glycosylase [Syntrophus sp. (in: bacteria)]
MADHVQSEQQEAAALCFSCQYFFITHEKKFPYGCRHVGFKSRLMPSAEMLKISRIECQFFAEKTRLQTER